MKTVILGALLIAGFSSFANLTKAKAFEINQIENLNLGRNVEKVWTIKYSEDEKPITITLNKHRNSCNYFVRSDFFEVVYSARPNGFGVKCVKKSECAVNPILSRSILIPAEFEKQRVITSDQVSEEIALGLIASYLPDLLREEYKHLIF